jgi:hypothetical protein
MKTHERNVLMWLASGEVTYQGCLRFLVVPLYLALLLLLSGCGTTTSTGPEPPELGHPNEILMQALIDCNANYHSLGKIDLFWFKGERRWFELPDGRLGFAACGAWPDADYVECDHAWVLEAQRAELADAAAHEVCHITGDLREPPTECRDKALEVCK